MGNARTKIAGRSLPLQLRAALQRNGWFTLYQFDYALLVTGETIALSARI